MVAKCSGLSVREMWIQIPAFLPTEHMPLCTLSRPLFPHLVYSSEEQKEYWSTSTAVRIKSITGTVDGIE